MLLHANGLFRLDLVVAGDTLRTIVRNLSPGELEMAAAGRSDRVLAVAIGEAAALEPSHTTVRFALGSDRDRVTVTVQIGTLHLRDRGTIRVSAQAIVREAPVAPS
jgi:2-methylaconitate cis-trans-isomerase PrpF